MWVLFKGYVALSYSFLTFVIRAKKGDLKYDDENYLFDPEQYNFIINRRNCFTCDEFAVKDCDHLLFVLKKMEESDPVLLEQLHYYYLY